MRIHPTQILSHSGIALCLATAAAFAGPPSTTQPPRDMQTSRPKALIPEYVPQFATGYEPGENTANPPNEITWMTFENISSHQDALPWTMSVYYENPGNETDRYAKIIPDPTLGKNDPENHVLHYWLQNAVIESGYQSHTKGRIQTGFPGQLNDAFEVYSRQRVFLHEDLNLLLDYPPAADQWWLSITIQELWMGAAWEGHPNPSRISLMIAPFNGAVRMGLDHQTMPDLDHVWSQGNLNYELPIGEWLTIETGYKSGNADTGRMVVVITPQSTGISTIVFDVNDWTYSPLADEPDGTGPVSLTHWNPQKIYTSDNMIHYIRDAGGAVQAYFDDFAFSGDWPPNWPQ